MTLAAHILLTQDDPLEGMGRILVIVIFLVIAAVASVAGKIKEKMERERARRQQELAERQGPPARRQPQAPPKRRTPAQEAAAVLRELFGEQEAEPPVQVVAPPAPPPRVRQPQVARRPSRPAAAPSRPKPLGGQVRADVRRMQAELSEEQTQRARRLGQLGHLRTSIPGAVGEAAGLAGVQVDLSRQEAARRAIVFMEIIGPPKALQNYPQPWEL